MSLADTIAAQIRTASTARLNALQLPADWILPDYDGRSIANASASIARLFGGSLPTPPLDAAILDGLTDDVRSVVLVVIDALGYDRLVQTLDANPQNGFQQLLYGGGRLAPLTSIFPSTTTTALASLWSGYTPAEHGYLGYQLFLRELGVRANMISFNPVATAKLGRDQLYAAGWDPKNLVAVPSLAQTLEPVDVPVYHVLMASYGSSAFARAQIRGAREIRGFSTSADMWVVLRQLLEERRNERGVYIVYWSGVDDIAHRYGPSSEALGAEVNNLGYSFNHEFLNTLSPAARAGTLWMLTADHGQIDMPPGNAAFLHEHADLYSHLLMDFAGEPRAAYLYCRQGEMSAARAYIESRLGEHFVVLDSATALAAGFFGPETRAAAETKYRIGDLLVLPRHNYALVEDRNVRLTLGRHGGLTENEMLVPLLAARLDQLA